MHSELDRLRRRPDLEAPGLVAVDAADRLILDLSAAARENTEAGAVCVIGDAYGALTLGAALAGATGIRVKIIDGECFGDQIVWFEDQAYEALVTVTDDPKTGLPTHLTYTYDSGHSYDKRGFEHGTNTWWRYEHEADPAEYREHCLRIVEIL